MIMATRAFHGESKKSSAKGVHPVGHIFDSEFLRHTATFHFLGMQPVETGGQYLIPGRIGNQITSNLLGYKLIICLIFTKRLDHPVPPRPDITVTVHLIAVGVGISCHI